MIIFTPRKFKPPNPNMTKSVDLFYNEEELAPNYNETVGTIMGYHHIIVPYQHILNLLGCTCLTFGGASIFAYLTASVDRLCAVAIPFK